MQTFKSIWLTVTRFLSSLPKPIAAVAGRRRQRTVQKEQEVERLDRIRNPSKYRGE